MGFSAVTLCNVIGGCQGFRRTYRLHLEEVSSGPRLDFLQKRGGGGGYNTLCACSAQNISLSSAQQKQFAAPNVIWSVTTYFHLRVHKPSSKEQCQKRLLWSVQTPSRLTKDNTLLRLTPERGLYERLAAKPCWKAFYLRLQFWMTVPVVQSSPRSKCVMNH